ncbi:MAG TPA: 7-carboxy-7-deazaguanine synthase QueE [Gammaproteobacteria bacterium]
MARLRVTEIFCSLQGESRTVGLPTVFVRLTGCPLRCRWCDTEYAFSGGEMRDMDAIVAEVGAFGIHHVTVTGGEPLAQRDCPALLAALCDAGHEVSLETSGALDLCGVDPRVTRVMDLKAPGSGEQARNRLENLACLRASDQLKFVLADRADYDWARALLAEHDLAARCELLFAPVHGELEPAALAQWILDDRLEVRFQLQLHKLLWGDARGR